MDVKMSHPKLENPDGSHVDFNDVSIESLGAHLLYGMIDADSMKEASLFILKANQLFPEKKEITLFLNTIGGSAFDGFALIDLMEISKIPVKTIGLGNIMSMGVFVLSAGCKGKRVMTKNCAVMAHQFFSGGVEDKFHEIMANYKADLYLEQQMIHHYKKHTNLNEKQIRDILFAPSDRWLTPTECKKYGLVDKVVDELPTFDLPVPSRPRVLSAGSKPRARK